MQAINIVRITNGVLLLAGLLFFKPLAYFVAVMMLFAGLTGVCLMEKLFNKFGIKAKCDQKG